MFYINQRVRKITLKKFIRKKFMYKTNIKFKMY